ncbi:MAG TPA: hypothetical protein VLI71_06375 [Gammaproteobacteria bacterium]|nr:hypothetical protein [Gammaproteobacteria bacterium]
MSKKPAVAWVIVVLAAFALLSDALDTLLGIIGVGRRPIRESLGTVMLCAPFAAASVLVIRGILRRTFRSRAPVSLYLWALLIAEPIANVLRSVGWYLPAPEIADEELAGAAFAELMRFAILLALIVWTGSSKALKKYFAGAAPAPVSVG